MPRKRRWEEKRCMVVWVTSQDLRECFLGPKPKHIYQKSPCEFHRAEFTDVIHEKKYSICSVWDLYINCTVRARFDIFRQIVVQFFVCIRRKSWPDFSCLTDTADGRNPKQPPGMYKTVFLMGYLPYQLVQDFSQQHMVSLYMTNFTHWNAETMGFDKFLHP